MRNSQSTELRIIRYGNRNQRPEYINQQRRRVVELEDVYGFGMLIMEVLYGTAELERLYDFPDRTTAYEPMQRLMEYPSSCYCDEIPYSSVRHRG